MYKRLVKLRTCLTQDGGQRCHPYLPGETATGLFSVCGGSQTSVEHEGIKGHFGLFDSQVNLSVMSNI